MSGEEEGRGWYGDFSPSQLPRVWTCDLSRRRPWGQKKQRDSDPTEDLQESALLLLSDPG